MNAVSSRFFSLMDLFKAEFKYYKSKAPTPDLSAVIDFYKRSPSDPAVRHTPLTSESCRESCAADIHQLGLNPPNTWHVSTLMSHSDGVYFIRNPFTSTGQRNWIKKCLQEYPRKPNITNVDHLLNGTDDVWIHHKNRKEKKHSILTKLRWVTLGYHHNWVTKVYDLSQVTKFPDDLARLAKCVTTVLGFKHYVPEAAIVNFYSTSSSLAGHIDHSELDHCSPLVSLSLGQTAIFLLGGMTKDVKPVAMYLQSGDIMVMYGPCRLAYHAVPRILPAVGRPWCDQGSDESNVDDDWQLCEEYISNSRINVNVRQVFTS